VAIARLSTSNKKIIKERKLWIANSKYEIKKYEKLVNNLTFWKVSKNYVCVYSIFFIH